MTRILGRNINIGVTIGGTYRVIGQSTECSINVDCDMVEMASHGSNAKANKAGRYGYTLSVGMLCGADVEADLLTCVITGTPLTWRCEGAARSYSGEAYVTNYAMNAPAEGYATANVSLIGNGELEI